jgi:Flp pilus assembly protein TadG
MSMKPLVRRKPLRNKRRGATLVELAIVLPLVVLMSIGLCVAELAVFRYQQVASLAHESARWASVHGKNYARRSKKPIATTNDILENVIEPRAVGLDPDKLTSVLEWNENFTAVSVTVSYQWVPEYAFFVPKTFTCTAVSLSSY